MAGRRAFAVEIDVSALPRVADALGSLSAEALGRTAIAVVNDTAHRFDQLARKAMNAGIALSDEYVSSRMVTVDATNPAVPQATITARGDLTILGHYNPVVTFQPAAAGKRAKGDPKRGIPPGMRAKGVQVTVRRGAPKEIPGAFTMTLKRGAVGGDKIGVFVREGGRLKHLYGVAPYSLLRKQIDLNIETLGNEFAASMDEALGAIVKVLT